MKIADIDFGNNLFLAPMAGVNDVGFRDVCARLGADATVSEMLSASAMLHNAKKTELMAISSPEERIKIGQIFGHDEQTLVKALQNPLLSHYDIIDINMGCPAPKIVKNGEGVALMKNIPLAYKLISACVKNSTRPISVKFRLGIDSDISCEFGKMCEDAGASFVTLHARTASQGYSGKADYEKIATLKSKLKIALVGNGDVVDKESYNNMLATGVDGVMIGRGAQGSPWLFSLLLNKQPEKDKIFYIKRHVEILRKYYSEDWLTLYLRKHFLWYAQGFDGAKETRVQLATSDSIDKSLELLEKLYRV